MLLAFERVMASGLLDRYPHLRVAFLELGCQWVPFMVDRVTEYSLLPGTRAEKFSMLGRPGAHGYMAKHAPMEYIQRGQVYFGYEADDGLLPEVANECGAECLLYASDIPHSDRLLDSVAHLNRRDDIGDETKRKLLIDNTARYYGMPIPEPEPTSLPR